MQRADVSGDAQVTAIDALMVINYLNRRSTNSAVSEADTNAPDVNGDGQVTALDALTIINLLNRGDSGLVAGLPDDADIDDEDELLGGDAGLLF